VGLADSAPPSQLLNIRSGNGGVTDTLRLMAQIARSYKANPLIRQTAARIVRVCPGKDDLCEIGTLQSWVRSNIRYTGDVYETETVQTPDYTLQERYGDCDDQAVLLATFLMAVGFQAGYCALGTNGGPFSHVLAVAILRDGSQWPLETTVECDLGTGQGIGPGWFPPDATCVRFWHI